MSTIVARPQPGRRSSTPAASTGPSIPNVWSCAMSVKSILLTAGIALAVVIAFEKTKGRVPGLNLGA